MISDDVDLLPALLLPLAGPEQFDEEDMQKLHEDLQYLPDDKKREEDPDIRRILLEALMKVEDLLSNNSGEVMHMHHSFEIVPTYFVCLTCRPFINNYLIN